MKYLKIDTRWKLPLLLSTLFWIQSIFAYFTTFNLGVEGALQYTILFLNPIAITAILFSLPLFIKSTKGYYTAEFLTYLALKFILFSNVVYYREFSDFITLNTVLGASKVSSGLGESALNLFAGTDVFYTLDLIIIPFLIKTKFITFSDEIVRIRRAGAATMLSILFIFGNITLAEISRPELLTRTFSRDYLVKYLGVTGFSAYDICQTYKASKVRASASDNDMSEVEKYTKEHYAKPDSSLFGLAKGRNVIMVHLESTQQFLIDYKLKDNDGKEHVVTPFLNELYHSKETFSFDNFFHQVKAGKTSDAETLMENSLFGLNQGALFTQLGGKNSFEAAPSILGKQGYSSAVFHGNAGTFWNRNEVYKKFGYEHFFDASYYDVNENNSFQYGLHDKPFIEQSIDTLSAMKQPFYTKLLMVSNHYPYSKIDGNDFPFANTGDSTVDGYFATANYIDNSVKLLFDKLKERGLYDNSIIVLYGDHYGVSNSRNKALAPLLGKDETSWTAFDNGSMQRVPYMIHIPGMKDGYINHNYGGQVDHLPTLLHLLGIDTKENIQLGQDLFSPERDGIVSFRDGSFFSNDLVYYDGHAYTADGVNIENPVNLADLQAKVSLQLALSDKVNSGDLFRFRTSPNVKMPDENPSYTGDPLFKK